MKMSESLSQREGKRCWEPLGVTIPRRIQQCLGKAEPRKARAEVTITVVEASVTERRLEAGSCRKGNGVYYTHIEKQHLNIGFIYIYKKRKIMCPGVNSQFLVVEFLMNHF